MTDLTKIEKPFGLLDEATQKALRECGGPWEWFVDGMWDDIEPMFKSYITYRQKPTPPKPRECWVVYVHSGIDPWRYSWPSEEKAKKEASRTDGAIVIRMREVIE